MQQFPEYIFRMLLLLCKMQLPRLCSASGMFALAQDSFAAIMRKRLVSLMPEFGTETTVS